MVQFTKGRKVRCEFIRDLSTVKKIVVLSIDNPNLGRVGFLVSSSVVLKDCVLLYRSSSDHYVFLDLCSILTVKFSQYTTP